MILAAYHVFPKFMPSFQLSWFFFVRTILQEDNANMDTAYAVVMLQILKDT